MASRCRRRRWCFTLHSPEEHYGLLDNITMGAERCDDRITGGIYQLEECPDTGALHFQGYLEFSVAMDLSSVRMLLGGRAHWEPAGGDRNANIDYCSKTASRAHANQPPTRFGTCAAGAGPTQGRRSDLDATRETLQANGWDLRAAAEQHWSTSVRYLGNLTKLATMFAPPRDGSRPCRVAWIRGRTGLGKSHGVWTFFRRNNIPSHDVYVWSPKTTGFWFEGYARQPWVVLDDLGKGVPLVHLLRLFDNLPYAVSVHGGQVQMQAYNFIVTTNNTLDELFHGAATAEQIDALRRRTTLPFGNTLAGPDAAAIAALPFDQRENALADWLDGVFGLGGGAAAAVPVPHVAPLTEETRTELRSLRFPVEAQEEEEEPIDFDEEEDPAMMSQHEREERGYF